MKHTTLLLVLLPLLPGTLALTCEQNPLQARIEILYEGGDALSPDGSVLVLAPAAPEKLWRNGVVVDAPNLVGFPRAASLFGRVVVGWSEEGHAFRWENDVFTDLSLTDGEAKDVSWDGRVVVGWSTAAVMWIDGVAVPLETDDGFRAVIADNVSAGGLTIVGQGVFPDGHHGRFLWSDGEVTEIFGLPDAEEPGSSDFGGGLRISADGTTVIHWDWMGDGTRASFRWRDGVTEPLEFADPEPGEIFAKQLSANGEVIVGDVPRAGPDQYAAIWDPTHGWRTLEALLLELGTTLPDGLQLQRGSQISSDGRKITALGWSEHHYCSNYPYCTVLITLPVACSDHVDNDGDGLTDFGEDSDCASRFGADEAGR